MLNLDDKPADKSQPITNIADKDISEELVDEINTLSVESRETNRLLTEIRDVLAELNSDEIYEMETPESEKKSEKDAEPALYDEIKFDP